MARRLSALIVVFPALATGPTALAAIIHVPLEQPTIQAGITAAATGDTVLVDAGSYIENVDFGNRTITVASLYLTTGDSTYVDDTVIRPLVPSTPVVTFAGGQPRQARLCGFTVTGALPADGCGIHCVNSSPTIDHNRIWSNRTRDEGAGLRIEGGAPAIRHNRIEANVTENYIGTYGGAGIFIVEGSPEIEYNRITGNTAGTSGLAWGGGICARWGAPVVHANVIGLNHASERGGGIAFEESDMVITDNEIYSNTVLDYCGGGIASRNGAPIIERNLIYDNDGARAGGGLFY
jgi:hypothetical protein